MALNGLVCAAVPLRNYSLTAPVLTNSDDTLATFTASYWHKVEHV